MAVNIPEEADPSYSAAENLQGRLRGLGDITSKKMFGGYGVFESEKMFALIASTGVVFFKVDDSNRSIYEDAGSKKHGRMPYYRVPDSVMDDDQMLLSWAQDLIRLSK